MYYLFAWHEGCQLGGAHDLVGTFQSKDEAYAKANTIMQGDNRFEVQVVDRKMRVIFESDNAPCFVRTLDEIRIQ
jgi:hypothetical protein